MQFRIIDTETSGPSSIPPDRICETASVDYDSESGQLLSPRTELSHIGIPMPPDAQGIHHISDEELKDKRDFSVVFKNVISPYPYPNLIMVAHSDYDQKLPEMVERIDTGMPWINTLKVAYRLWPDAPNHKNQTLRYYLKVQIPGKMQGGLPHRALPDAVVTALILIEGLKLASPQDMIRWSKEPALLPKCPIGKKQGYAGRKWSEITDEGFEGFLHWMLDQPDMEPDLKWNAEHELKRRSRGIFAEERANYMLAIPAVISSARNIDDLRQWFKDEEPTRLGWSITQDTPEYQEIVRLCGVHKTVIAERMAQELADKVSASA